MVHESFENPDVACLMNDFFVNVMVRALRTRFLPHTAVIVNPTDEEQTEIIEIAEFTRDHRAIEGNAVAYVCVNGACRLPTTDITVMLDFLDRSEVPKTIV